MGVYVDEFLNPHDIIDYIDVTSAKQTITFSISMPNPTNVITGGGVPISGEVLAGLQVWIDDVYLKKYDNPDNLVVNGDIENVASGGLSPSIPVIGNWYVKNRVEFGPCKSLDDAKTILTVDAITEAYVSFVERKSGKKSITLKLDGIHYNTCTFYDNLTYVSPIIPNENEIISAAIDFDYRDFIGCNDYSIIASGNLFQVMPSTINSLTTLTTDNLLIENDVFIQSGGTLSLAGCQIAVKPHSPPYRIVIEDNGILHLTHDGSNPTRIFACEDMWGGIESKLTGRIDIFNGGSNTYRTEISDAITALDCDGGFFEVRYTDFNNNLTSISLSESTNVFEGTPRIYGCNFNCPDGYIKKLPYPGVTPLEHVRLENVMSFTFPFGDGSGSATGLRNKFSNAYHGLNIFNSTVFIANNYFQDISNKSNATTCIDCGIGINVTLGGGRVTIGGEDYESNNFSNVNIGIKAKTLGQNSKLMINNNVFNNSNYQFPLITSNFFNTAITIQEPYTSRRTDYDVNIFSNKITDNRIGIHAENVFGIIIGADEINDSYPNKIDFHLGATPNLSEEHIGIWLQNCNSAHIRGSYDPGITNIADIKNDIPATGSILFKGIDVTTSVYTRINCNFIENIPISMSFYGNCSGAILRKNNMTEYDEAIHLELSDIGIQKQINSSGQEEPTNNYWFDSDGSSRVDGATLSGTPFDWYYDQINNTGQFIPQPSDIAVVAAEPDGPPNSVLCNDNTTRIGRDDIYGKIIDDSLTFVDNISENNYIAKYLAFIALKDDTSIIYQSVSRDSAYLNFYLNYQTSNISLFDSIISLLGDTSSIDEALVLNSSIVDTNDLESYRKIINDIYLNTIALNLPMDESDSLYCYELASMSYFEAGDAIYTAAAMIGREIHPQGVSLREIYANATSPQLIINSSIIQDFSLNPNPTSNTFGIYGETNEINSIKIFNNNNIFIKEIFYNQNQQIDISHLNQGIYYVQLNLHSGSKKFLKLIVLR